MREVLAFGCVLLAAVLISERAHRSVLSTALLFLAAGAVLGDGGFGVLHVGPDDDATGTFATLALFAVLFADGMKLGASELREAWRLPGRALLLGMPLTLFGTALAAHLLVGLSWISALLVGAALSPTDPVFAAAIVRRSDVPQRLRTLLNVESGLNDGLALPVVVVLLSLARDEPVELGQLGGEVLLGVALGIAVALVGVRLSELSVLGVSRNYAPLGVLAIGLIVLSAAELTHANTFLAAFAAGSTIATVRPGGREVFGPFAELIAEVLKLAALLVFGALLTPMLLRDISAGGIVFAVVALVAVRPIAIGVALARSPLSLKERAAAGWFGAKGFSSVVYGLVILHAGISGGVDLFRLVAVVVAASMIVVSSTDVLVARRLQGPGDADGSSADDHAPAPSGAEPRPDGV